MIHGGPYSCFDIRLLGTYRSMIHSLLWRRTFDIISTSYSGWIQNSKTNTHDFSRHTLFERVGIHRCYAG